MAQQQNMRNEERHRALVEKMWLNYYNNSLLEKGLITRDQHRRMKVLISSRKSSALER